MLAHGFNRGIHFLGGFDMPAIDASWRVQRRWPAYQYNLGAGFTHVADASRIELAVSSALAPGSW